MNDETSRSPIEVLAPSLFCPLVDNIIKRDSSGAVRTNHVQGNLVPFRQNPFLGDVKELASEEGAASKTREMPNEVANILLLTSLKMLPNGSQLFEVQKRDLFIPGQKLSDRFLGSAPAMT